MKAPTHERLAPTTSSPTEVPAPAVAQPKLSALILDDSRTDAYVAQCVAEQFFDNVTVCGTPHDFKLAALSNIPDVIFMDVHIGDLHNGVAIVDEIRRESSELSIVPIVVVTSSKDESVHNLAMECRASGIIVKPLTRERLLPLLPQLLPGFSALAD